MSGRMGLMMRKEPIPCEAQNRRASKSATALEAASPARRSRRRAGGNLRRAAAVVMAKRIGARTNWQQSPSRGQRRWFGELMAPT